jgi:hypothetical protein
MKEIARYIKRDQHRAAAQGDRKAIALIMSARRTTAQRRQQTLGSIQRRINHGRARQRAPHRAARRASSAGGAGGGDDGDGGGGPDAAARSRLADGVRRICMISPICATCFSQSDLKQRAANAYRKIWPDLRTGDILDPAEGVQ